MAFEYLVEGRDHGSTRGAPGPQWIPRATTGRRSSTRSRAATRCTCARWRSTWPTSPAASATPVGITRSAGAAEHVLAEAVRRGLGLGGRPSRATRSGSPPEAAARRGRRRLRLAGASSGCAPTTRCTASSAASTAWSPSGTISYADDADRRGRPSRHGRPGAQPPLRRRPVAQEATEMTDPTTTGDAGHGYAPVNGFPMYYEVHGRRTAARPAPAPRQLLEYWRPSEGAAWRWPRPAGDRRRAAGPRAHRRHRPPSEHPERTGEDTAALLRHLGKSSRRTSSATARGRPSPSSSSLTTPHWSGSWCWPRSATGATVSTPA